MSYPLELDEFSTMELLQELKRRLDLRSRGLCDYCRRPIQDHLCRFPTRHIGDVGMRKLAAIGDINVPPPDDD